MSANKRRSGPDIEGQRHVVDLLKRRTAADSGERRRRAELELMLAFRTTSQQVENTVSRFLGPEVGSMARFQILAVLWGADGQPVPHGDLISSLRVTRATLSGLMTSLERGGLVTSAEDGDDRRRLNARLTPRGNAVVRRLTAEALPRLDGLFREFSLTELRNLTGMLLRMRASFAAEGTQDGR